MTYEDLLATLHITETDKDDDECLTCSAFGLCRDRADTFTRDVVAALASAGIIVDEVVILQWLLDNGSIDIKQDENAQELAIAFADAWWQCEKCKKWVSMFEGTDNEQPTWCDDCWAREYAPEPEK